jgi:hypothetical protein
MLKIDSIAAIRAGVTLRGRDATRPVLGGPIRLVRIGDISREGRIAPEGVIQIRPAESIGADVFLRPGDVLVAARGTRNTAAVYNLNLPGAIAGAQFFVLRPKGHVLPEFIAWYLRSDPVRLHFDNRRKGTHVQLIQRADIAEIEIPLPPMNVQRRIVALADLIEREHTLSTRLADLRCRYQSQLLLRATRVPHRPSAHQPILSSP